MKKRMKQQYIGRMAPGYDKKRIRGQEKTPESLICNAPRMARTRGLSGGSDSSRVKSNDGIPPFAQWSFAHDLLIRRS